LTRSGSATWADTPGVLALPCGALIRGRAASDGAIPADFSLLLAAGPTPSWRWRRLNWPDFWVPRDPVDAIAGIREAHSRAEQGERVEVVCRGGIGRTGTALAAMAVLDGVDPDQAVAWVRAGYHPRAVETPWQRRWLRRLASSR